MIDFQQLEDEQWWAMCDAHCGRPVPLMAPESAQILTWVYWRPHGIFHVPFGYHQQAMALLYAFHHGRLRARDMVVERDLLDCSPLADAFLMEIPGTAFLSSVGRSIIAGRREHLDRIERIRFGYMDIRYLEDR
jgi:hypothetical protein